MLAKALVMATLASAPMETTLIQAGQVPSGWTVIGLPEGDGWQCANRAEQEWTIAASSTTTARVTPLVPEPSLETRLELADGVLVGTNHGEFGGKIEWRPRDLPARLVIDRVNPVAMIQRGDDVLIATGLAHMTLDAGEILRLSRAEGGDWVASKALDLGEAPNAATRLDDRTWVILTTKGVSRVDLDSLKSKVIHRNRNWWWIYGNSIVPVGDAWVIGARRAVIRLSPNGDEFVEEWLVPKSCALVGSDCRCGVGP